MAQSLPIVLARAAHCRDSGEEWGVVGRVRGDGGDISRRRMARKLHCQPIKNSKIGHPSANERKTQRTQASYSEMPTEHMLNMLRHLEGHQVELKIFQCIGGRSKVSRITHLPHSAYLTPKHLQATRDRAFPSSKRPSKSEQQETRQPTVA